MSVFEILSVIFVIGGLFFFSTATIGLIRFPDFFTRLHATGKGDTLAVFLVLVGLGLNQGFTLTGLKIMIIALFMIFAQPTATHAISRAGMRFGLKPWMKDEEEK